MRTKGRPAALPRRPPTHPLCPPKRSGGAGGPCKTRGGEGAEAPGQAAPMPLGQNPPELGGPALSRGCSGVSRPARQLPALSHPHLLGAGGGGPRGLDQLDTFPGRRPLALGARVYTRAWVRVARARRMWTAGGPAWTWWPARGPLGHPLPARPVSGGETRSPCSGDTPARRTQREHAQTGPRRTAGSHVAAESAAAAMTDRFGPGRAGHGGRTGEN